MFVLYVWCLSNNNKTTPLFLRPEESVLDFFALSCKRGEPTRGRKENGSNPLFVGERTIWLIVCLSFLPVLACRIHSDSSWLYKKNWRCQLGAIKYESASFVFGANFFFHHPPFVSSHSKPPLSSVHPNINITSQNLVFFPQFWDQIIFVTMDPNKSVVNGNS